VVALVATVTLIVVSRFIGVFDVVNMIMEILEGQHGRVVLVVKNEEVVRCS
jgi:hypothetical protein